MRLRINGEQRFNFTVESLNDATKKAGEKSGVYNINIDKNTTGADKIMLLHEVQCFHGKLS